MLAAGDQDDRVSGLVQPGPDAAADRAGSDDDVPLHGATPYAAGSRDPATPRYRPQYAAAMTITSVFVTR